MQMFDKYSRHGWLLSGVLLLSVVFMMAGCRNEPPPPNTGTPVTQGNGKEGKDGKNGKEPDGLKSGPGDNKQANGKAKDVPLRLADDLLGDKLKLYEDLTKIYKSVRGPSNYDEKRPEIERLEAKLEQVEKDYQKLPPEMRRVAEQAHSKDLLAAKSPYLKSREAVLKFKKGFPKTKDKDEQKKQEQEKR